MRQVGAEERVRLVRRHLEDGVPWTQLASEAGVPLRTLHRWAHAYRTDPSLGGQQRQPRSDRGTGSLPDDLVQAIEGLALQRPVPTVAFIHRRISDVAKDRGMASPSYTTVRRIITGIDPGLRTLAVEGGAAYRDRFELVHRRTASGPNEQWQADHTLLDVMILDAQHEPVRPWLTVILDDYSRAAAGYTVFQGAPSAEQTALAFHHAVTAKPEQRWPVAGLPDVLYSDHGSDFTSARLERVCLETHVRLIHSRPGIPQGRGKIERFFRTITTELLPHLPGYIPHGTNGTPTSPPELTLEQLDQAIGRFIIDVYLHRPHSTTGQAPAARWEAGGWIPRMPAHPEDLDLLLLTAATGRKVQRDGIRFASTRCIAPGLVEALNRRKDEGYASAEEISGGVAGQGDEVRVGVGRVVGDADLSGGRSCG
jgi:putative transposase